MKSFVRPFGSKINGFQSVRAADFPQSYDSTISEVNERILASFSITEKIDRPTIIIVNEYTYSAGVGFAVIMGDNNLAIIVGKEPTSNASSLTGIGLLNASLKLPFGSTNYTVSEEYITRPDLEKGQKIVDLYLPDEIALSDPETIFEYLKAEKLLEY